MIHILFQDIIKTSIESINCMEKDVTNKLKALHHFHFLLLLSLQFFILITSMTLTPIIIMLLSFAAFYLGYVQLCSTTIHSVSLLTVFLLFLSTLPPSHASSSPCMWVLRGITSKVSFLLIIRNPHSLIKNSPIRTKSLLTRTPGSSVY